MNSTILEKKDLIIKNLIEKIERKDKSIQIFESHIDSLHLLIEKKDKFMKDLENENSELNVKNNILILKGK